jgi:hypothetical protein
MLAYDKPKEGVLYKPPNAELFAGALVRMLCEERLVKGWYPEYREYARTTKRMIRSFETVN